MNFICDMSVSITANTERLSEALGRAEDSMIEFSMAVNREYRKSVLSVAALALYVAVVFWPMMLAK